MKWYRYDSEEIPRILKNVEINAVYWRSEIRLCNLNRGHLKSNRVFNICLPKWNFSLFLAKFIDIYKKLFLKKNFISDFSQNYSKVFHNIYAIKKGVDKKISLNWFVFVFQDVFKIFCLIESAWNGYWVRVVVLIDFYITLILNHLWNYILYKKLNLNYLLQYKFS